MQKYELGNTEVNQNGIGPSRGREERIVGKGIRNEGARGEVEQS